MGYPTHDRPKGNIVWLHCHDITEASGIIGYMSDKTVLLTYIKKSRDMFFGPNVICQYAPIDNVITINKFLKFWEPSFAINVRLELRPNHITIVHKLNIPIYLINGSISEKSYRRWKILILLTRNFMPKFTFVWATNNKQTLRMANLGAHDISSQESSHGRIGEILQKLEIMRNKK
jgi:3-deoxy-D-manno-octulosonic-acid transferase